MNFDALATCMGSSACSITQVSTALIIGMLLFLVASGLSLIFGVLGVTNFTHGGLYMLGAYFAYTAYQISGSFALSMVAGTVGVGLAGIAFERLIISRVYGCDILMQLLVCYAITLILDDAVKLAYGADYRMMGMPSAFDGAPVSVGGGFIPGYYIFMVAISALAGLALWLAITHTRLGKITRALAVNPRMVGVLGINTSVLYALVFGVGSALAGLAGALAAPIRTLTPGMGLSFLMDSFIVTVIGGMGSIPGALVAALLIGFIRAFGAIGFPLFTDGLMFALMALVLMVKPSGLLGREAA